MNTIAEQETTDVPDRYKKLQKQFKFWEGVWRPLHYLLGGGAAITATLAALAAGGDGILPSQTVPYFSAASAVLAAVVTFAQPGAKAKAYRNGRDVLRFARLRIEADPAASPKDTLDAIKEAQAIVRGD